MMTTINNAKVISAARAAINSFNAGGNVHTALRAVAYGELSLNYDECMLIDDCLRRHPMPVSALYDLCVGLGGEIITQYQITQTKCVKLIKYVTQSGRVEYIVQNEGSNRTYLERELETAQTDYLEKVDLLIDLYS